MLMLTAHSISLFTHPSASHAKCSLAASTDQTTVTVHIIGTSPSAEAQNKGSFSEN